VRTVHGIRTGRRPAASIRRGAGQAQAIYRSPTLWVAGPSQRPSRSAWPSERLSGLRGFPEALSVSLAIREALWVAGPSQRRSGPLGRPRGPLGRWGLAGASGADIGYHLLGC